MKKVCITVMTMLLSISLHAQGYMWVKQIKGTGQAVPTEIIQDKSGNYYVYGNFNGQLKLETITINAVAFQDIFLAKYSSNGTLQWVKTIAGAGTESAYGFKLNSNGNYIYLSGVYNNTISICGTQLSNTGGNDIFLAKLDLNGNVSWAKDVVYGATQQMGGYFEMDASDNIVLAGTFVSSVTFAGGSISLSIQPEDPVQRQNFVAKFDNSGNTLWAKLIYSNSDLTLARISSIHGNDYFVSGQIAGNIKYDGNNVTTVSSSYRSGIIMKINTDGSLSWHRKIVTTNLDLYLMKHISDNSGNQYIAGKFAAARIKFDSTASDTSHVLYLNQSTTGTTDLFIAKYNQSGTLQWVKLFGNTKDENVTDLTYTNNQIVFTGSYGSNLNIGGFVLNYNAQSDGFLAVLDLTGTALNAINATGKINESGNAASFSKTARNYAWVGEFYSDTLYISSFKLPNDYTTRRDGFVSRFGCFDSIHFTVTPVTCVDALGHPLVNDGAVTAAPSDGNEPYTYTWSNGGSTSTISNLGLGTFYVTVTGTNGCTLTGSAVVGHIPILQASITSITGVNCAGTTTGSATVTATNGVPAYAYSWSNGAHTATVSNLPAGTYYVSVNDYCKTTIIDTAIISTNPPLTVTINGTNVSCYNGNNGTAIVSPANNNPPYSYHWNTGATTQSISNLTAGNYIVTVTDACNATVIKNITITQPALLTAFISSKTDLTCNGVSNGSATANASGGTSPYTFLWNDPFSTPASTVNNLPAGMWTVTVTDNAGCTATTSVTINQPSPLIATVSSQTNVNCNGESNGAATVTVSGGNLTVTDAETWESTHSWTIVNGTQTNKWYVGTATAHGGAKSIYISNNTADNAYTITGSSIVHFYKDFTFPANATNISIKFDWKGNGENEYDYLRVFLVPTTTTPTAGTALSTGQIGSTYNLQSTYTTATITGLDASAGSTKRLVFSWKNDNSVGTQPPAAIDNIIVSYNTSGSFLWSNGQTTATISGLSANTYTVTVTDESSCTATTSVTITEPSLLSVNTTGTSVTCNGSSNGTATANPTGGTSPYSYLWQTLQTTQTINGLSSGTYYVTVTDAHGCTTSGFYTVNQGTIITLTPSHTDANCGSSNGSASISASGGISPYTYLWSTGATTSSINNLAAGAYTVTVTDNNSCTASNTVIVNNIDGPTATISSSTNISCHGGNNGAATVTASGGTSTQEVTLTETWESTHSWTIVNGTQTNKWYVGTATASSGTKSIYVSNNSSSNAYTVNRTSVVHFYKDFTFPANATNITVKFDWKGYGQSGQDYMRVYLVPTTTTPAAGTLLSTGQIGSTYNLQSTFTTATITGLDVHAGTTKRLVFSWRNNNSTGTQPPAAVDNIIVSYTLNNVYTYVWSNGQTTASISGLTAGTYTVTVTDVAGCEAITSVNLTQPSALIAAISSYTNISCNGQNNGSATVTASGGTTPYTYLWNTSPAQTTQTSTSLSAGTWYVTVTDNNGCTAFSTITISEPSVLSATISSITHVTCYGGNNGSLTVTPTGGMSPYSYNWTGGQSTSTATNLTAGLYSVTVTDNHGCTTTASASITQNNAIVANIVSQTNVTCSGSNNGTATVSATGGVPVINTNEDWEGTHTWTLVNGSQTNKWYVGTATAHGGTKSIYISNNSSANAYTITSASIVHFYKNITLPANATNITVKFDWKGNGESNYDYLNVYLVPTTTTPVAGTALTTGQIGGPYNLQNIFITQTITGLDASAGSTQRLVFSWKNDASVGTQPPAAIDNIIVSYNIPSQYTYVWSTNPAQTTTTATGLTAGVYTVTVTDANLCTATAQATILQNSSLTANITSQTNVSCHGGNNGAATVTTTGGDNTYTYKEDWEGTHTWTLVNGSQTNKWYVGTATASGGTKSIYISNNSSANAYTVNKKSIVHFYKDITFPSDATGITIKFDWKGNGESDYDYLNVYLVPTTITPVAGTALTTGQIGGPYNLQNNFITQTITGLDASAGSTKRLVFSWKNDNSVGTQPPAAIDNIIITYESSIYTYVWNTSPAQTSSTAINLTAGNYTVTVTDNGGCTATAIANITQPFILSVTTAVINTSPCVNNGSIMANPANGTSPYTYHWNTGATTQTISNLAAGIYNITVTDACTATASTSATVAVNSITVTASTVCATPSCNGSATASVSGGNAPYTYLWSDASHQTTATATNLCVGTYAVTVTDALGCTSVKSTIVVSSCSKEFVTDSQTIETDNPAILDEIAVYPNPANSWLNINLPIESMDENVSIEMYDITGKLIYQYSSLLMQNEIQIQNS